MRYSIQKGKIIVKIQARSKGKFRFKTRETPFDYGKIFSTRKKTFDKKVYLEWQIGYDALVKDVKSGKKITSLKKPRFIGANGKSKNLYELSELLYKSITLKLISKKKIKVLLKEIEKQREFFDKNMIKLGAKKSINKCGVNFEETSIKLPTLFMIETADGSQIEISIQKQQYATGVQPMVYFCIPLSSFNNYNDFMGRSSVAGEVLIYTIDKKNSQLLLDLMKIFAMCSERHNHDVKEILTLLITLTK